MIIDKIITSIILVVGFYVVFLAGKIVHSLLHREYNLTKELVEKDNPAVALAVCGYYAGLTVAIGGCLTGPSAGWMNDLIDLGVYGAMGIVLLNISWLICDRILLPRFRMTDELIRDQNIGTGAVSFGVSVGSGFVIYGAMAGTGGSVWTSITFWAIGQVLLVLGGVVYNLITPFDLHGQIEKDNVAAGVGFGGALIAVGIVVGLAAEGDFTSWSKDLVSFLSYSGAGILMLPVVRFLTDKILLPTVRLTDEIANQEKPNLGAGFIEGFSYIAAAFVIYWCV